MRVIALLVLAAQSFSAPAGTVPAPDPNVPLYFEAASVKPNTSGDGFVTVRSRGGVYTARGLPLRQLIRLAYQVQDFQVVGGPRWLDADRFDVEAKVPSNEGDRFATEQAPSRTSLMLRAPLLPPIRAGFPRCRAVRSPWPSPSTSGSRKSWAG